MSNILELISKYETELTQTLDNMGAVKKEMARLNQVGMELTAKANELTGRIKALKELDELNKGEVVKNED